ncbi:cation:proton antiporter [Thiobacter aerophilum]|uniref:Cation:proton antiporter n=1 Tax=Thiobacter aerophilum TaxID=3121275 RepID=A0ABV0EE88_9BURK
MLAQPPRRRPFRKLALLLGLITLLPHTALAAGGSGTALHLAWIALLLMSAKLSSLVERFGQPAVVGELLAGILLGNLALVGITGLEAARHDEVLRFLAEFGVIILLFQIGLESEVQAMRKVGWRAFLVACIGVAAPFALGVLLGPYLFPDMSFNGHLFLGATLTATSVGVTARVFKDMNALKSAEAQIVLGAAVIDDVIGLIILAVVSGIVTTGSVSLTAVGWIILKAVLFLAGAVIIGQRFAPLVSRGFARIHTGVGMKFAVAISTCLLLAWVAGEMGLAPIVGAFAAGLVLDEVIFKDYEQMAVIPDVRAALDGAPAETHRRVSQVLEKHADHHLEALTMPVANLFVPLFFVYTGMQVDLTTLADWHTVLVALAVTAIAFAGKLVSGLAAGQANRWLVGWGMAPRGEVGLIFAVVGSQLGVVTKEEFSVVVIMVMLTTLLTPMILSPLIRHQQRREG